MTYVRPGTGEPTGRKCAHKPHATCKAERVLISASVVLLSFLFPCEWIFIFGSDFCFGSWFVVCICHHSSRMWLLGRPRGQGSGPVASARRGSRLPKERGGWIPCGGTPGELSQSHGHCSCPGSSAATRSPTWGFFSLFLCYLHNASKDYFGNI